MRAKVILFFIFVLVAGFITSYGCTPVKQSRATSSPSLQFDQPVYNFGRIQKGQTVAHTFTFTNTGNEKLVISKIQPACSCTVAITSSNELLPGATGTIKVTFNSSGYFGPVTKTITVLDNDPAKPAVELTLTGEVVTDFMITKPALFFGSIKKGQSQQQSLDIFIYNPSVKITDVTSTKSYIKVSTVSQSISQQTMSVAVLPDAGYGPLNASILIFSSSKEHSVLQIPVIGNIVGDILINPDEVNFGVVKATSGQEKKDVYLYTRPQREFSVTKIAVHPDIVRVNPIEQSPGSYRLELTLKPIKTAGNIRGSITVHTTMKTMPIITIPFIGSREP